jgi:hypothetical protein
MPLGPTMSSMHKLIVVLVMLVACGGGGEDAANEQVTDCVNWRIQTPGEPGVRGPDTCAVACRDFNALEAPHTCTYRYGTCAKELVTSFDGELGCCDVGSDPNAPGTLRVTFERCVE